MKQVTIKDVARVAGVSFSTVSRCLNDSPLSSKATSEKVKRIAKEMGFEFNVYARGLITKKAHTIAVVLPEDFPKINVNVYHGQLLNIIATQLEERDVDIILTYQRNHFNGSNNIVRLVARHKVDGFIILTEFPSQQTLDILRSESVPTVFAHFPATEMISDFDCVFTDNYEGGKMVADYFLAKGHSELVLLAVKEPHKEFELRKRGFCDSAKKAGAHVTILEGETDFNLTREMVAEHIDVFHNATAVFGTDDLMALGAMRALQDAGFSIPDDLAIFGFDDSDLAHYSKPALSSLHQPKEDLACMVCQLLFSFFEEKDAGLPHKAKQIAIKPIFVARGSS